MGTLWKSYGNPLGTLWELIWKVKGNPMGKLWEPNGNPLGIMMGDKMHFFLKE